MARDQRHREQVARADAARVAANRRLRDAHPEEYLRYYEEEAESRGVVVRSVRRRAKRERLLLELAALEEKDK